MSAYANKVKLLKTTRRKPSGEKNYLNVGLPDSFIVSAKLFRAPLDN